MGLTLGMQYSTGAIESGSL